MGGFLKGLLGALLGILLSIVLFIGALIFFVGVALDSLIPTSLVEVERGSVLEINMDEMVVDAPQMLPLINLSSFSLESTPIVSMLDLLTALDFAAEDPRITAVSLRMDGDQPLSLANAAEIRNALISFRTQSAKPIYAYSESYSQVEYYLASIADTIYINPLGSIEWQGVAINSLYFGDLLSGLGVKVEVFRPEECTYKSAVEPYYRSSMSEQSREQSQRLVDTFWGDIVGDVAASRNITTDDLRTIAKEQIVVDPSAALQYSMVSNIGYRDEYDRALEGAGVVVDDDEMRLVTLSEYSSMISMSVEQDNMINDVDDKIAVIYADGTIVDGDRDSATSGYVVSGVVARQLRKARLDDDIRGVVLRVNSPGGSALASDVIWREMSLLRDQKPVIVSMGSYAASGGYYISAPADLILADRYTLTGSIGVYGVLFTFEDALRKNLGISLDGVVSSPSADFGRVAREITPIERAAMMRSTDDVYNAFVDRVARGRKISPAVVEALGGGRVWSGQEAVECGLVDDIGGFKSALGLVIDRCGLSDSKVEIVEMSSELDEWEIIMEQLMGGARVSLFGREVEQIRRILKEEDGSMMNMFERVCF